MKKNEKMVEETPQIRKRWWETTTAIISALATLIIAITGVVIIFTKSEHPPKPNMNLIDTDNLLNNGGFEEDLEFWGTGYYETDVYKGSQGKFWASRVGMAIETMKIADVMGKIDSDIRKSGVKSFKITNNSPLEAHIYGSMSQRITGLMKNTDYIVSFWAKTERADRSTFEITTDLKWLKRKYIEAGTYDWKQFSHVFNTEDNTFIDFRIISEKRGTVWVDDMSFKRYFPAK